MSVQSTVPKVSTGGFGDALFDPSVGTPEGVIGPDGQPDAKRFNVYRNNVVVSLCEALGETFPAIKNLLGDEYFSALARAFVMDHPPRNPVLMWYGAEFADFIAAFPPLASYPYLGDVARLEWAWGQAYHAADIPVLEPAVLGAVPPEELGSVKFVRHAAAALLTSEWPVWDLVRINRFEKGAQAEIDLSAGQTVLVTRPEFDVDVHLLLAGADEFSSCLLSGKTLGEAADAALSNNADFPLSDCLSDLLTNGAFADLYRPEAT
ncbi:DUF2063 domain-containing protein [Labrenzia sp. PHM005]|uniref:HvfC/BufC N-terminal domain-containing protein n=1 Tax=Labrenzia sp. PHM005 TaxID=2590016 RepID=UPI0011401DDC|nr:DNA-binding domain-containing protein [Labrenzia sp. PHM005]QDG75680.1 DUF2063 domain-containing protein [Labrenzia sp. PHM005]